MPCFADAGICYVADGMISFGTEVRLINVPCVADACICYVADGVIRF